MVMSVKGICFLMLVATLPSLGQGNIKVAEAGEGGQALSGATVALHPRDSGVIVVASGGRFFKSHDKGKSFNELHPPGIAGTSPTMPQMIFDAKAELYLFTEVLSADGRHVVMVNSSGDAGKSWSQPTLAGVATGKDQRGLAVAVNIRKQILYGVWTQYDKYGDADPNALSHLIFGISGSGGRRWSKPMQVSQTPGDCTDGSNTIRGGNVAIAGDGRLYAAWASKGFIYVDRSYDDGETWLFNDLAVNKQTPGWSMLLEGFSGETGWPVLRIDTSPKRSNGTLMLAFADQRNGVNDTDIWFVRSTNRGDMWTSPIRVNQDTPGHHQFMPVMAFDPLNAAISIAYFDRREAGGVDVYLAESVDGGNTFKETKISDTPFTPDTSKPQEHSLGIASFWGTTVVVWIGAENGKRVLLSSVKK